MVDPRNKDPIKTLLRLAPWTEQVKEITYLSGGYSNDNYYYIHPNVYIFLSFVGAVRTDAVYN